MKTFSHFKYLASVSCFMTLAACDSIKDVPNEDAASLPPQTVVLSGQINGLSSLRAITLQNNDDTINTKSFINAAPTTPNEGVRPVPFSFGALPAGTPYNITVKAQPELKNCVVVNGQGVLTPGVNPNIVINCTNRPGVNRYSLSVHIPSTPEFFKGLDGAKVRVTTEEEIREVAVNADTPSPIVFEDVLITAPGAVNAATYSVTASTFEGNRINKCVVTLPSGSNPTGPVSNVVVGAVSVTGTTPNSTDALSPACQFKVGGKVGYSLPPGQTTPPTIAGLKLQLRDLQMNTLEELDIPNCTLANGNVTTTTQTTTLGATVPVPSSANCAYEFNTPVRSSSTSGVYEVAVSQHPVGQFCIVTNGGSVSVFTQGLVSPVNVTNANVFCRATPAAERQISGVFRLKTTIFEPNAIANEAPRVVTWRPFDLTQWNVASSNMMTFFDNGTFLHGTHGNGAQVEHGFYDYDPVARTLRFSSIVDTNTSAVFPANFSPVPNVLPTATTTGVSNLATTTPGLSALPNPIRQAGSTGFPAAHAAMTGVTFGTAESGLGVVRTISGKFGDDPAGIAGYPVNTTTPCSAVAPCINTTTGAVITSGACSVGAPCYGTNYAYRVSWVLEEPPQIDSELTGAWVTQDSRRMWVWDYRTYYGTAVGMAGGSPSMNDACFTLEDLHAAKGIYTRRSALSGCTPYARPANDPQTGAAGASPNRNGQYPGFAASGPESVDLSLSLSPLVQLPGFTGRIPGGEPTTLTSSPSPVYYQVAPAATFSNVADPTYFPPESMSWCTTEILGLRPTANGFPINYPVYYCRTNAALPE